ncbi:MAG: cytochrome c3 family protein, partial [Deltaproteobacteria bacterium]|nr:cytochrome c3 family protein [Deltaproteobacteria bacterium]
GLVFLLGMSPQCRRTAPKPTPTEPSAEPEDALVPPTIRFSHKLHAEQSTCLACHLDAEEGKSAGQPSLEDCTDCHDGVQSEAPEDQIEEEKLAYFVERDMEIEWPRPALLLSGIIFSHQVHVVEGELDCGDCHEDIAETSTLPDRTNFKYDHGVCGDCHEVDETDEVCLLCHPR